MNTNSNERTISNITIKNIKGFNDKNGSIDVSIKGNKINILVAPNGFGKSSIALAFSSLTRDRLNITRDNLYEKNVNLEPKLSLLFNNKTLESSQYKNEISKEINCYVINSKTKAKSTNRKINNQSISTARIAIEPIIVFNSIPTKINNKIYNFSEIKCDFGKNSKLLKNINTSIKGIFLKLNDENLLINLDRLNTKTFLNQVKLIKDHINSISGNYSEIINLINNKIFNEIQENEIYNKIVEKIGIDPIADNLSKFLIFYQVNYTYQKHKNEIKQEIKYNKYEAFKSKLNKNLSYLNTTWKEIRSKETKGQLIVEFPDANEISNGQRDILTFVVQLTKFQKDLKQNKQNLLIIDEVFDYLDDANLIAAQFYLSKLFKEERNLFLIILTHLDPYYFKSYVLNDRILNIQYLKKVTPVPSENMIAFIKFRGNLNKSKEFENDLNNKLSKYFFHYHPNTEDINLQNNISDKINLKFTWFKGNNLKYYLAEELNKYLFEKDSYDPCAVCLGIRIRLEKIIYDQLNQKDKSKFLEQHNTNNKLKFAESINSSIIDSYYFLSSLHNNALHLKKDNQFCTCVYKLNHPVIKNIILNLFNPNKKIIVDFFI